MSIDYYFYKHFQRQSCAWCWRSGISHEGDSIRPPFVSGSLESAFTYCQKKDKRRGRYRTKGQGKKRKFSGKKSPKGLKAWTGHRVYVVPVPVSYIFWLTWAVCPGTTSTKKQQLLFWTLVIFSGGTVVILFSGSLLPSVVTI